MSSLAHQKSVIAQVIVEVAREQRKYHSSPQFA
jgi:hypothetical protein